MSSILFRQGKQNIGNKAVAFNADTFKASLLTMSSATGKAYLVTAATNASPIVLTCASTTGITAGDVIVVGGVGGNISANGTWQAGTVTGTTVQLLTLLDGNNSTGSGVYTSGGYIVDITSAATITDLGGNGGANGNGTDITLTGVTNTGGTINASAMSWSNLSATKSYAVAIYDSTASNDLIAWIDGMYQVYVITQAAASSTSIAVARLSTAIASGTVINFSDGTSATLSAQANVGATSLTVNSTAAIIHAAATADVTTYNVAASSTSGLPFTPGAGAGYTLNPDTGVNKLLVL